MSEQLIDLVGPGGWIRIHVSEEETYRKRGYTSLAEQPPAIGDDKLADEEDDAKVRREFLRTRHDDIDDDIAT